MTHIMHSGHDINAGICPLCGAANHCVMAGCDSNPDTPCWCKHEHFPTKLLDKIPTTASKRACICKQCLRKHRHNSCWLPEQ